MGKGANMYFLIWAGIFHSKHVNFVQKLGKLVVTMLTLKNFNIPAEIFSFLTISCSHTYLFVSILQRQSLCLERHLFECQVFFFSLGRLARLWLLRVINQLKITWIRSLLREEEGGEGECHNNLIRLLEFDKSKEDNNNNCHSIDLGRATPQVKTGCIL